MFNQTIKLIKGLFSSLVLWDISGDFLILKGLQAFCLFSSLAAICLFTKIIQVIYCIEMYKKNAQYFFGYHNDVPC